MVSAVVGIRSGFPSSSSALTANVALADCWSGFGLDVGEPACFLHSAINTPVTISPNPVAVPPSPIKIGDMSSEMLVWPANRTETVDLTLFYFQTSFYTLNTSSFQRFVLLIASSLLQSTFISIIYSVCMKGTI